MSWSNRWIGKPSAIVRAMEAYSLTLSGNSKNEFDQAAPAIKALISMNDDKKCIDVDGNGHAYHAPVASESYSTCQVTIKSLGTLVE